MPRFPLACLAALFAPLAVAHPQLPDADWCAAGTVEVVGLFAYDGAALDAALHAYCENVPRNCGEFDHAYEKAMTFANDTCAAYQGPVVRGDAGQVIPFVMGPPSYIGQNHHAAFSTGDGLYGYCLLCKGPANLPVAPGNPVRTR